MAPGPFTNPALTGTETTNLLTPSAVRAFLDVAPRTVVAQGQITAPVNRHDYDTVTELTVSTTAGNWSNVGANATILIGTTNGAYDVGIFRTRKAYDGTLHVMAISGADIALLTSLTGLTNFVSQNQYVTALSSQNLWQAIPRIDVANPSAPVFYKDWDKTWNGDTISPPPIINIGKHISCFYDSGQSYATLSFAPWMALWSGMNTPVSFTWTLPAGATLISGSTSGTSSTAYGAQSGMNITIHVTYGFWLISLSVTGSPTYGGAPSTSVATRYLWVHDGTPSNPGPNYPPTAIVASVPNDVRDENGRQIQMTLYKTQLSNIYDGQMANYWEVPLWTGGAVATATTSCPGWVFTHKPSVNNDSTFQADVTLLNPGYVLQAIRGNSQRIDIAATPADWQHATAALCNAEYMMFYMMQYHAPAFLVLFDYYPYQNPGSNPYLGVGFTVEQSNILGQMQKLALMAGLQCGCDSYGTMWTRPHPSLCPSADRSAQLILRDQLVASLYATVNWQRTLQNPVGKVRGEGFLATGVIDSMGNSVPTPALAEAPGVIGGQGVGDDRLQSQVVTSGSSLQEITGHWYAWKNNPYPSISIPIPNNRDVYEPAQQAIVALTVPSNLSPTGAQFGPGPSVFLGNWHPLRVTKRMNTADAPGCVDITLEADFQTEGGTATAVAILPPVLLNNGTTNPNPVVVNPPNQGVNGNWTHTWNLASSAQGWTITTDPSGNAHWSAGNGFTMNINGGDGTVQTVFIDSDHVSLASGSGVTAVSISGLSPVGSGVWGGPGVNGKVIFQSSGAGGGDFVSGTWLTAPGGTLSGTAPGPVYTNTGNTSGVGGTWPSGTNVMVGPATIYLTMEADTNIFFPPTNPWTLFQVTISGTGVDPFIGHGGTSSTS